MMKKILILLMLLCSISMTGCKEDNGVYEDTDDINNSKIDFAFEYKGNAITIGEEWLKVYAVLGDYDSSFVSESCAYEGTDTYYYYDDFEIMTSRIGGKELVTDIFIQKEKVTASKGIYVGMALSDMAKLMGPADKSTENGYVYYGGNVNIQINAKDDKIESIEYYYVQE